LGYGTVACLVLALVLGASRAAQPGDGGLRERVKFTTADQVELHGGFYPSMKGRKAPCVLLLHPLGGSEPSAAWGALARRLQAAGFAVLGFDFRGHGGSTAVGPGFWRVRSNQTLKSYRPVRPEDTIHADDFATLASYLMMVNDIAAAKRFLDRKNDNGECNSADLVVLGAQTGATLGALWVAWEWQRRRLVSGVPFVPAYQGKAEGEDIACAIWLSLRPSVGGPRDWSLPVAAWLYPLRQKVPMCFFYGAEDRPAARFADYLYDKVLKGPQLPLTFQVPLKGTKLAGVELLGQKDLATEDLIFKYLDKVLEDRATTVWSERNADRIPLGLVPIERFIR
jgi:pimeloyl-ACP methyl ester carboxylesterase